MDRDKINRNEYLYKKYYETCEKCEKRENNTNLNCLKCYSNYTFEINLLWELKNN